MNDLTALQANTVNTAPSSSLNRIRYPNTIFTIGYLNDPIQFSPDPRFEPQSLVTQTDLFPNLVSRDFSDFLVVDYNNPSTQDYAINMFSPVWDRTSYYQVMGDRIKFTQLV